MRLEHGNKVDIASIEDATGKDIVTLLGQYTQALVFKNASDTEYSLNKAAAGTLVYHSGQSDEYSYPMKAIDLWSQVVEAAGTGPVAFGASEQKELRPYGFTIHYLGNVDANCDSVTLNFTTSSSVAQRIFIMAR